MDSIHVHGGVSLQGNVRIQGSKNAALPVLAATILTKETNVIHNCPKIADVYKMLQLLTSIGCFVNWEGDGVRVDSSHVNLNKMPAEAITEMRSSLFLVGTLLGQTGEIVMDRPGGCVIGERTIDLHIFALEKMGVSFFESEAYIHAVARNLHGADILLEFPSVGATENIILAAVMAEGTTVIENAAREPEVVALCQYLKQCGAWIEGEGSSRISITGGQRLYGSDFAIPADRVVAGTYLFAALGTRGSVLLEDAPSEQMEAVISLAEEMGAECQQETCGLYVQASEGLQLPQRIMTEPYPGFPTDLQSVALACMTGIEGICIMEEKIFENRFRIVEYLKKMGADITTISESAVRVNGGSPLQGCTVEAKELRGGAALIIAALMAEGETQVQGCHFIYRGYENICRDLRELGARIYSVYK